MWYLKRCPLFEQLSPEKLAILEARCRARRFPRGAPIYLPMDAADGILLLAEGRVKIGSVTQDGRQTILAFIEPGELFGELALVDSTAREEFAEAVEKSSAVLIPREVMQELVESNPHVSLGVTKIIGLRRQRVERRLKYLLYRSNRERLTHLLIELAERYGRRSPEGIELTIKLSHQDLASIVGSTRETVTVVLGELQSEGRLTLGRRKIVLTDLPFLAQSVNVDVPRLRQAGAGSR
jgi:CRP-like cAMP-binding protein